MAGERTTSQDWTELIVPASPDWETQKVNSPVVKVTWSSGDTELAVIGAKVGKGKGSYVVGMDFEIDNRAHSSVMNYIPLSDLRRGVFPEKETGIVKIEFLGLASDKQFKDKKWSYW